MKQSYSFVLLLVAIPLTACGVAESPSGTQPTAQITNGPTTALTNTSENAPPTTQATQQPPEQPTTEPTAIGPIVGEGVTTPGSSSPPLTSIPNYTPTPLQGPKVITLQDQQQIVKMHVGEAFLLQLGNMHTWRIQIADERILRTDSSVLPTEGAQGMFTAPSAGKTVLEAYGTPHCAKNNPPCMQPDILFEITVIVE